MASLSHRFHPDSDVGDDPGSVLWDDCGACLQNASDPLNHLDYSNIRRLFDKLEALAFPNDYNKEEDPSFTETEIVAISFLILNATAKLRKKGMEKL